MASDAMIHIDGLNKSYGATHAVRGISFDVPKGQVVGFLGPNGAGKSTTMKILTGYVSPSSGTVQVGGISVVDDPVGARKKIGYLPENNPLYEDMMVEELLGYVAHMRELGDRTKKAIDAAVERCGLTKVRGKDIGELSKGFRQRVGLAQAILHDPDLLILDEPTTGLDPNQVVEIRDLIRELGKEKTVILSTHVLPEVQHMCTRALIIAEGKLVADGHPSALTKEGAAHMFDVVLAARGGASAPNTKKTDEVRALLAKIGGVEDVRAGEPSELNTFSFTLTSKTDVRPALFDAVVDNGLMLMALHRKQISLEDTFRKLTAQDKPSAGPSTPAAH